MIYSMTAFARKEQASHLGTLVWEIRSVNQRFLETNVRLPETLRVLEPIVRDLAKQRLGRGKLDCTLRYEPNAAASVPEVNESLVLQLKQLSQRLDAMGLSGKSLSHSDVLRWPGVLQIAETDSEALCKSASDLFDAALTDLIAMRGGEGEQLKQLLIERLDGIDVEIKKAQVLMPEVKVKQREKLLARFEEAKVELDPTRVEQEMVMFAQRIDVEEELDRLNTHVVEIRRLLKAGGTVGRRLDFLIQELHREANTLSSKSVTPESTAISVELKVYIEQMREQVQNIE